MSKVSRHSLTDEALHAFWNVIARHYRQGSAEDLDTPKGRALRKAADAVVREWLSYYFYDDPRFYFTVPLPSADDLKPGHRFKLRYNLCRQSHFVLARTTGTITEVAIKARLDVPAARFRGWDREVTWDTAHEFLDETRLLGDPE